MVLGILLAISYIAHSSGRIYRMQGVFFILGLVPPLIVNLIATLGIRNLSIAATPLLLKPMKQSSRASQAGKTGFASNDVCHVPFLRIYAYEED